MTIAIGKRSGYAKFLVNASRLDIFKLQKPKIEKRNNRSLKSTSTDLKTRSPPRFQASNLNLSAPSAFPSWN